MDHAMQRFVDQINEVSRAHAANYATIMFALLEKGIITPQEMEAAREKAMKVVDEHFGPTPEEKTKAELAKFLETFKPSEPA